MIQGRTLLAKTFYLLILFFVFFYGVSCNYFSPSVPEKKTESAPEKKVEEAIPVRVTKAKIGSISNYLEASSVIESKFHVDVFPKITGEILEVCKEEGMLVTKGETLAKIDPGTISMDHEETQLLLAELQHQFEFQKITLQETTQKQESGRFQVKELAEKLTDTQNKAKQADRDFSRSEMMLQKKLISEEAFEDARLKNQESQFALKMAEVAYERTSFDLKTQALLIDKAKIEINILENKIEKAKLNLKRADFKLGETQILAPISGVLAHVELKVGQQVQPSLLAFSILDPKHLELKVGIPERDLRILKKDQPVRLFNEIFPLQENTLPQGVIHAISPVVQKETGTVKVTIQILKEYTELFKPGMFVSVQIITECHPHAVLIPKKALLFDDNIPFVFLLTADQHAKKLLLKNQMLGFKDKFNYEVLEQIKAEDTIIVVGQSGLKENALVQVVSEE